MGGDQKPEITSESWRAACHQRGRSAAGHNRSQTLRESCQRLLTTLGHPVHYGMLAGIVWADTGLRPSRGELISALRILTNAGVVERIQPGVYQATPET